MFEPLQPLIPVAHLKQFGKKLLVVIFRREVTTCFFSYRLKPITY